MIYLDTTVVLAHLLAEDRQPPETLWTEPLVSSRLLEYQTWVRLHGRGLGRTHGELARDLLARVALLDLTPAVLARALEPFPLPVRTLDALHLASVEFLRSQHVAVQLASYDDRMLAAARGLHLPIFRL